MHFATFDACILCGSTGPLSEEHVFPECAGGALKARLLCSTCNSNLGRTVDNPYGLLWPVLAMRHAYSMPNKGRPLPRLIKGVHSVATAQGVLRFSLDSSFKPSVITEVSQSVEAGGIQYTMDASNRRDVERLVRRHIKNALQAQGAAAINWTEEDTEATVQRALQEMKHAQVMTESVTVKDTFKIDLNVPYVSALKALFEMGCLVYGASFLATAAGTALQKFFLDHSKKMSAVHEGDAIAERFGIRALNNAFLSNFGSLLDDIPGVYYIAVAIDRSLAVWMRDFGLALVDVPLSVDAPLLVVNDARSQSLQVLKLDEPLR